jgi:redox-sensitive bicupin YhaK (pirin superfamily)
MIEHKPFEEIGGGDLGWLKAKHHFAIGDHGNPAHKPVGNLIVFNDDEVAPHTGFGLHPHANLEIISYIQEGAVSHHDDLGNKGITRAGDVQVMSAGTGIRHAESNDEDGPLRAFQIWLKPRTGGGVPRWGTKPFPKEGRSNRFVPLASGRGNGDALEIRSDAEVLGAMILGGSTIEFELRESDAAYLVPATGSVRVNGVRIGTRDGATIRNENRIQVEALVNSEVVLIVTGLER